jgi:class 3 adenylate cyclase
MTDQLLQRRLAALVVPEVDGYSRLMEADEATTLSDLWQLRSRVIEPIVTRHNGRIFKVMGDGFLIELISSSSRGVSWRIIILQAPYAVVRIMAGWHLSNSTRARWQGDD